MRKSLTTAASRYVAGNKKACRKIIEVPIHWPTQYAVPKDTRPYAILFRQPKGYDSTLACLAIISQVWSSIWRGKAHVDIVVCGSSLAVSSGTWTPRKLGTEQALFAVVLCGASIAPFQDFRFIQATPCSFSAFCKGHTNAALPRILSINEPYCAETLFS